MEPHDNLSQHEILDCLKSNLTQLDMLTKSPLDVNTSPQINQLTRHIFDCAHKLEHHLKVKFKRNLLGLVEDFQDYTLDTSPKERHDYQQILQKNITQLMHDIDHAMLKRKSA